MRKMIIGATIVALLISQQGFAQSAAGKQYDIKGSVKGINSGTVKLMTYNEEDRTQTTVDSTTITNGSFELKGSVAPQMMTLRIEPGNWGINVFVEGANIILKADTTGSEHYDYTKYGMGKGANIKNITETGSKSYDDWMNYQNDPGQKQYDSAFADLDVKFKATGNDIDAQYKVRDQMDSVSKLKEAWQLRKIKDYVSKNPSSPAGIYMFDQLYQFTSGTMSYGALDSMINSYSAEATQTPYYKSLVHSRSRLKAVQPGSLAPDFTLFKSDSSKFTLSSVTKGKYTMIDFWASWCHPCRQAIPHWKSMYQKYHDKGFDIVSVSDDNSWKAWTKAMGEEKMPWTQVDDRFSRKNMPADVGSLYMTTFIPFYVLLDKEGKILVYSGDEAKIDAKLKEIYGD